MNIKKALITCLLALMPALALSLPITSLPTDTVGPLRHNVFHDASLAAGGANGNVLAWFDLNTLMSSTWDPATGALSLHVNIYSDSGLTNLLGTGHATSANLAGAGFNDYDDISLGFISWTFSGAGAVAALGAGTVMDFIDHNYASDSTGNVANSYVGNTVTLWGADGVQDPGTGDLLNSFLGVDMVFTVPEPAILLLMAMGLLGIGASTRRR